MSKLFSVIRHEYKTIVKQPSFWIIMVAIPLFIGIVMTVSYFGTKTSMDRVNQLSQEIQDVTIVDDSGFILPEIVEGSGQRLGASENLQSLKDEVANGEITGLIYYPSNLAEKQVYQVFINGNDFTTITTINAIGDALLSTSIFAPIGSAETISLAQNGSFIDVTTYEDGQVTGGMNDYIIPGLFAFMFLIVLMFSVNYMLASISEEKENRSIEMALTYVNPRTLIVGKLIAVVLVTLTQLLFFALVAVSAYLIARSLGNSLISLPAGIDLSKIVLDPTAILFGFGFLISGFMLFAGLMAITAAALPSKQANAFAAVFYVAGFAPFWFLQLILTDPENPITRLVTFFPLTSPVVSLVRNTVGNMSLAESALSLAVMTVFMLLSIWLAIRVFRLGALEFNNRVSLRAFIKG